ncbi:MAG TPA: AsnC family transcriptional regulator [Methanotrichaceae archaeon]|nr:AsnC family transcriptional regulator [Methanotrichaceae archaeon]
MKETPAAMDDLDRKLLSAVQEGFPVASRPFQILGDGLSMPESEVISRLDGLMKTGLIRRIGPILEMRKLGFSGVLVALKVTGDEADRVAMLVNEYEEVSHNYLRPNETGYNLWFTVSAREDRISNIISEISSRTGLVPMVLPTTKIFKIGVKFDI